MVDNERKRVSELLNGYLATQIIFTTVQLNLAGLCSDGPKSLGELALGTGAHPPFLDRLIRTLVSYGLFEELVDGRYSLTPGGRFLDQEHPDSLYPFAISYGQAWWWKASGELLGSLKTGKTGFEIAHGEPFFDYLSKNEAAASVFNQNMLATTREESAEITTAYYFPEKGVLVDIGGGHGALTEALLEKYPQLNAWVFDLPEVIDSARARWDSSPFKDQIRLISGSFFDSIPSGGDLYCLKDILHDWNDEDCVRILKNCRAAMSPEAKLCIIERFLPEDGSASPARRIDMIMMILTGGLERTELEYRQLLEQAGFKIGKIVATPGGTGIIEAQPDGRLTGPERTL